MSKTCKKNFLVTGSSGFLGRHLIRYFVQDEAAQVFGLARNGNPKASRWHSFEGDILHPDLATLLNEIQPEVIFHTVAAPKTATLAEQMEVTVRGTENLFNALLQTGLRPRVVVLGSAAEYGIQPMPVSEATCLKPNGDYGIAKAAQTHLSEAFARTKGLDIVVGRIFNAYGRLSDTLAIASLASQIVRQEKSSIAYPRIKVQNLLGQRDFIHTDDVVSALVKLSAMDRSIQASSCVYNIASGRATSLRTVVDTLIELSELTDVEVVAAEESDLDYSCATVEKIQREVGWMPLVSLEEGLRQELNYWRERANFLTA